MPDMARLAWTRCGVMGWNAKAIVVAAQSVQIADRPAVPVTERDIFRHPWQDGAENAPLLTGTAPSLTRPRLPKAVAVDAPPTRPEATGF